MKWTPEKDEALRAAWGKEAVRDIATRLGTSEKGARYRAATLGIKMVGRRTVGLKKRKQDRRYKRWSPDDDRTLRTSWGEFRLATIAKKLGRGLRSLRHRATHLGLPSPNQGRITINSLHREGYEWSRLRSAMTALGIKPEQAMTSEPRRRGTKPRHYLTDEEAESVIAFLAKVPDGLRLRRTGMVEMPAGQWGVSGRPAKCIVHGGDDKPHVAKGMCGSCYKIEWRREYGRKKESKAA